MSSPSSDVRKVVCEDHAFYYRVSTGEFLGSTHHSEAELRSMIDLCFMLPEDAPFPDFGCHCVEAIFGIANSPIAIDYQLQRELRSRHKGERSTIPDTMMDPDLRWRI